MCDFFKVSGAAEDASINEGNSRSVKIPQGTPIAFNLRELLIHGDGSIQVIMEEGIKGGFLSDQPDGSLIEEEEDMSKGIRGRLLQMESSIKKRGGEGGG